MSEDETRRVKNAVYLAAMGQAYVTTRSADHVAKASLAGAQAITNAVCLNTEATIACGKVLLEIDKNLALVRDAQCRQLHATQEMSRTQHAQLELMREEKARMDLERRIKNFLYSVEKLGTRLESSGDRIVMAFGGRLYLTMLHESKFSPDDLAQIDEKAYYDRVLQSMQRFVSQLTSEERASLDGFEIDFGRLVSFKQTPKEGCVPPLLNGRPMTDLTAAALRDALAANDRLPRLVSRVRFCAIALVILMAMAMLALTSLASQPTSCAFGRFVYNLLTAMAFVTGIVAAPFIRPFPQAYRLFSLSRRFAYLDQSAALEKLACDFGSLDDGVLRSKMRSWDAFLARVRKDIEQNKAWKEMKARVDAFLEEHPGLRDYVKYPAE